MEFTQKQENGLIKEVALSGAEMVAGSEAVRSDTFRLMIVLGRANRPAAEKIIADFGYKPSSAPPEMLPRMRDAIKKSIGEVAS